MSDSTHDQDHPQPGSIAPATGAERPEVPSCPTPPPVPDPPESHPPGFQQLNARVIDLWRLQQLISSCVLLGIALIGGGILAIGNPSSRTWILGAWLGLFALRLFLLVWYPGRAFKARGYRIDSKVLESRHGIFFRVITLLPLSRLQHVDLNRGPLERMFGLASLVLYTAGTQHAMLVIPGLEEAEAGRLRDHLVAMGGDDAV